MAETTPEVEKTKKAIRDLQDGGVEKLDLVLSEILKIHEDSTFFAPWKRIAYPTEAGRHNGYLALAKKLGPLYAGCSFSNFSVTEAAQKQGSAKLSLEIYAEKLDEHLAERCGMLLYGNSGTGKDHLMAAVMFTAILKFGFSVAWVNGLELYEESRQVIDSGLSEKQFIDGFCSPLILAISDPLPPKGDLTRYNLDVLFRIIDRRQRHLLTTWVTMNVAGGDEAENRMAANIVDRLRDQSLCLHFDWQSYRKPK